LLALLTAATALASSGTARAYCRTTTEPVEASYDSTIRGCPTGTAYLAWPQMPVKYQVALGASSQISLSEATALIDRSFAKWSAASCSESDPGKRPSLSTLDIGPTDAPDPVRCEDGGCGIPQDAVHGIYFRDDSWPYDDTGNTLALTTLSYGSETGHLFAAVMEINTHDNHVSESTPPPAGAYSLEAIVTHEAGHFIGLAHSGDTGAIMFARYHPDAVTLTADDTAGVCAIYPPATSGGGCSAGSGAGAREVAGGAGACGAWLLALAALRRRLRRQSAHVG
jgi:hypothetical protein